MIQGLVHTPKWVNWLENHHSRCHEGGCLACALGRFSIKYWEVHQSDAGYNIKEGKPDMEDDKSKSKDGSGAGDEKSNSDKGESDANCDKPESKEKSGAGDEKPLPSEKGYCGGRRGDKRDNDDHLRCLACLVSQSYPEYFRSSAQGSGMNTGARSCRVHMASTKGKSSQAWLLLCLTLAQLSLLFNGTGASSKMLQNSLFVSWMPWCKATTGK